MLVSAWESVSKVDLEGRARLSRRGVSATCLRRAMPVTGHTEVLARDDPATPVDDSRRQRALVRVDPDDIGGAILADQQRRGPACYLPRPPPQDL